ncbi:MAG: HK97 gp10 family phage protein, partial [Actinobacteria bacterium]|nr:HK97 gp10 family phage protein [Actinomycetota bacterium]
MSGIELTGLDKLTRALKAAGDEAPDALSMAMFDEMEEIVEDAKRRAPVDTGTLRASGVVLKPDRSSGQI